MRGFAKAAALLSFTKGLTLAIPNSLTSAPPPFQSGIEYTDSEKSLLNFNLKAVDDRRKGHDLALTIEVKGTEKACGDSHVLLNGLRLDAEWDGLTAHGRDYLDFDGATEAEWHITCLFNTEPSVRGDSVVDDVVHVLSLRFSPFDQSFPLGFTISYKQTYEPAIIRIAPHYIPSDFSKVSALVNSWRIPSIQFDPDVLENAPTKSPSTPISFIDQKQKSLGKFLKTIKGSLGKGVGKALEHLCGKHTKGFEPEKANLDLPAQTDGPHEIELHLHEEVTASSQTDHSTSTTPNLSAAETRSLSESDGYGDPTSTTNNLFTSPTNHQIQILKIFGLILVLGSLVVWICLRCRDPRRRADCLARREERRNKKLYRRAARQHKWKMRLWNFRMRFGLASSEAITWDEKRSRVTRQESILEEVMTDDIWALRNAHRSGASIAAAEEGNAFVYDPASCERRRSVSTLPGYSSDQSQPPNYDEMDDTLLRAHTVDGVQFNRGETEFKSDSSVISTSPRISRDGSNSDFDEKFDSISLDITKSTNTCS